MNDVFEAGLGVPIEEDVEVSSWFAAPKEL